MFPFNTGFLETGRSETDTFLKKVLRRKHDGLTEVVRHQTKARGFIQAFFLDGSYKVIDVLKRAIGIRAISECVLNQTG